MKPDERTALGARAYHIARTPDIRARTRAIVRLVQSYLSAFSKWEPVGDDERTDPDVCRHCGKPVKRIVMHSGRVTLVDPRPRRLVVLADDPCGFVATCYRPHFESCGARPQDRLRYEPDGDG